MRRYEVGSMYSADTVVAQKQLNKSKQKTIISFNLSSMDTPCECTLKVNTVRNLQN